MAGPWRVPIDDWDETYFRETILQLPSDEGTSLDFKTGKSFEFSETNTLVKFTASFSADISAFANSGGGLIVFGVKDKTKAIEPAPRLFKKSATREWLSDKIPFLVREPFRDFEVYQFVAGPRWKSLGADDAILVVEIRDSQNAPFQARDHRYYARSGHGNRPLLHHEIELIRNRTTHPLLECSVTVPKDINVETNRFELGLRVENVGPIMANYVATEIWLPALLMPATNPPGNSGQSKETINLPEERGGEVDYWRLEFREAGFPVLPGRNLMHTLIFQAIDELAVGSPTHTSSAHKVAYLCG